MPKRYDGTGSVRQKGNTWYGRWHLDGAPTERSLGPVRKPGSRDGLTRAQAEAALREKMAATTAPPEGGAMTIVDAGAALVTRLENRGKSKGHWQAVESHVRVHLATYKPFESKTLDAITRRDVDTFISALTRKGLAPKTIRNIASSLHSIFELGRREKWNAENPVEFADLPDVPKHNELRFLTITEVGAVIRDGLAMEPGYVLAATSVRARNERELDYAMRALERALYLMAATTGMRMGELLELRWREIDWLAPRVRVIWNTSRGVRKNPKGDKGRSVPLTADLLSELQAHSERSAYSGDDDLVFGHPFLGTTLDRSRILKRWKKACDRAGVRQCRFHDLRHTWATLLASNGATQHALQEWGGWEDAKTAKRYMDYSPAADEATFFGSIFGGILAGPTPTIPPHTDLHDGTRSHTDLAR
jgi:integrase